MTNPDLDHLVDFLNSPGWQWFKDYAAAEWGPSGVRYQQAVRDAAVNQQAVVELQKVLYAQEQVLNLMRHPGEILATLRAKAIAASPLMQERLAGSRRGPGL